MQDNASSGLHMELPSWGVDKRWFAPSQGDRIYFGIRILFLAISAEKTGGCACVGGAPKGATTGHGAGVSDGYVGGSAGLETILVAVVHVGALVAVGDRHIFRSRVTFRENGSFYFIGISSIIISSKVKFIPSVVRAVRRSQFLNGRFIVEVVNF